MTAHSDQPMGGPSEPSGGGAGGGPAVRPPERGPRAAGIRRRTQRRLVVVVPLLVAVVTTSGLVAFTRLVKVPTGPRTSDRTELATTEITRRDLVQRVTADAVIGYGQSSLVTGRKAGTLTWLPTPGAAIGRGEPLYSIDAVGVWLLFGDIPTYRPLARGVPAGPDIAMLQQNLAALGYPGVSKATGTFDAATARALRRWQRQLKVPVTGTLQPQDVTVLPGPVRVDSVTARLGASATGDIMKLTGTERLATATLELSQRQLASVGASVTVTLADGRSTAGTVRTVVTEAADQSDSSKKPKLTVTVSLDDAAVAATIEAGTASVTFDGERRTEVLTVPVEALLALREGGYAVEVVDSGGGRRLVAVQLGLFADGRVEISGTGLVAGTRVVTTS